MKLLIHQRSTWFLFLLFFSPISNGGVDEETIFNWAEINYPHLFSPSGAQTQETQGYLYRYYPATNTYAGAKEGEVFVLGDVFDGLLKVGSIDEVLALVNSSNSSSSSDFTPITNLTLTNDQSISRDNEVAFSGIPIAQSLQLFNTDSLAIVDHNNQRIPAQFEVLSRWGGLVSDTSLPIRWLEVAFSANVNANSSQTYSLGYDNSNLNDSLAASITSVGSDYLVDTGVASYTLDPNSPALLKTIKIGTNTLNVDTNSAGPKLILANNTATQVQLDRNSFQIIQDGPVKVVVAINGHFIGNGTQCQIASGAYEAQGFTLLATFSRAQSYVDMQFHYRNECSDAENAPWTDDAIVVDKLSYELPISLNGTQQNFYAANQSVASSTASTVRIVQQQGSGTPWTRQAKVQLDGSDTLSAESFQAPFVAISTSQIAVSAQMGWMRFREPQALQVKANNLSIEFISQSLTVGEARGIWNFARLNFLQNPSNNLLETARQQGNVALERGLIPKAGLDYINQTKVFAHLGNQNSSQVKTEYLAMLNLLHNDTINAQWSDNRTYGSQLWPDIQFSAYPIGDPENSTPSINDANMNYWNASRNELTEYIRSGDVKWAWDFALPQTWLQFFSAYANIGAYSHGNRNGFALTSGGCGRSDGCANSNDLGLDNLGHWHRSGFGSDDYTYTHGDMAYVVRPNYQLMRRFAQAGLSVINRYVNDTGQREQFVSERVIQRQVIQHFVLLANCAEFVPGAEGQACHDKLKHIMQEFNNENFANGYMCLEDNPGANECFMPQQFMQNSLMYPFFYRIYLNYADTFGSNLKKMLVNQPWTYYYQHNRPSQSTTPDYLTMTTRGTISVTDLWPNELSCTYNTGNCNVNPYNESPDAELYAILEPNKAHTMSLLLMAEAIEPNIKLCQVVKTALEVKNSDILGNSQDVLYLQDLWFSNANEGAGWSKGTSQMLQGMAFAVGLYDSCSE